MHREFVSPATIPSRFSVIHSPSGLKISMPECIDPVGEISERPDQTVPIHHQGPNHVSCFGTGIRFHFPHINGNHYVSFIGETGDVPDQLRNDLR